MTRIFKIFTDAASPIGELRNRLTGKPRKEDENAPKRKSANRLDREALDELREFARKYNCALREDSADNIWNQHKFEDAITAGWDEDVVTFLAFHQCPFNPPEKILRKFRHIEKVNVRPNPNQRFSLVWLGCLTGVRSMEIYRHDGEETPSFWACEDTLERLYLDSRSGQIPDSFQNFHNLRELGLDSAASGLALGTGQTAKDSSAQLLFKIHSRRRRENRSAFPYVRKLREGHFPERRFS